MGRGVGGSNLGQTQVELSGLNRVFHELPCPCPGADNVEPDIVTSGGPPTLLPPLPSGGEAPVKKNSRQYVRLMEILELFALRGLLKLKNTTRNICQTNQD